MAKGEGEKRRCRTVQRGEAQADDAFAAEMSQEGQDGGGFFQKVFWSPPWADQPAISELTTSLKGPILNTLTHVCGLI